MSLPMPVEPHWEQDTQSRLSPHRARILSTDVRPMNLFGLEGMLAFPDQESDQLVLVDPVSGDVTSRHDLHGFNASWFCDLLPESNRVWLVSPEHRTLVLMDLKLNVLREVPVPGPGGFCFEHDGRILYQDGLNPVKKLYVLEKDGLRFLDLGLSSMVPNDTGVIRHREKSALSFFLGSREVHVWREGKFRRLLRFHDFSNRLYNVQHLSYLGLYIVLAGSDTHSNGANIRIYNESFHLIRSFHYKELTHPGNIFVFPRYIFVSSRQDGYLARLDVDLQCLAKGVCNG